MTIYRRYFDEEEWGSISEETARKAILKCYEEWEPILEDLQEGFTIRTSTAYYAMIDEQ